MNFGPFHLTNDVSITGLVSIITLLVIGVKFVRHIGRVDDRVDALWKAVIGEGPQDSTSFFYRFAVMEERVREMWDRLQSGSGKILERRKEQR